jgi:hypothetical protein
MRIQPALRWVVLAVTLVVSFGCATEPEMVASVSVSPTFPTFDSPRAPAQLLTVTVTGENGRTRTDIPVTWAFWDWRNLLQSGALLPVSGVVTVDRVDQTTWQLRPVGQPGLTSMYAFAGGHRSSPIYALVNSGPPVLLIITRHPTTALSGAPLTVVLVETRDADRFETSSTLPITASIASGNGTLSGTVTVVASRVETEFRNLIIEGAGVFTLRFTAPGLPPAFTMPFAVTAR